MTREMRERFDVVVIGLGAMGAATVYELSRRSTGLRILGLEQHSIPNALASHHGESRMIRLCYYEHPSYVPLLHRAYELWDDLERTSGRKIMRITGGLYMGHPDERCGELVPGTLRAAAEHNLPHEKLSADDVRSRFPMFNLRDGYEAVIEPRAGFLMPEVAIEAFCDAAMRRGAVLRAHEPVRNWRAHESGVIVESAQATYEADHLVICAGAWSGALLREIGVELSVSRQTLGWFWPRRPDRFEIGAFPVWGIDDPPSCPGLAYGFPIAPGMGRPGLKIARHFPVERTTPEAVNRIPTDADRSEIERLIAEVFPEDAGPLLSMAVCLYTNTPDSHFIIDSHPEHPGVTFATGFSGHGFKFASVIGEILADLALDGRTAHSIDFLRLGRLVGH